LTKSVLIFNLLISQRADARIKRLVAEKGDPDLMRSRSNQHPSTRALKLSYVPYKRALLENCGPRRVDRDLGFGGYIGKQPRESLLHGHTNDLLLSRLEKNSFCEVLVAVLAHRNYVFAR
jgi:hypothetical protein